MRGFAFTQRNAFLAPGNREREIVRDCPPATSVKHMIEVLGVPHTEIDLLLANGQPIDFCYRMRDGDSIEIFPASSVANLCNHSRLPGKPLHGDRFIADAHLGKLARRLRMLGFDTLYDNHYRDADLARISVSENRIVLTRDRDVLIQKAIVRGCFLHTTTLDAQLQEVLARCHLETSTRPFTRCLVCNSLLIEADRTNPALPIPERSRRTCSHFRQCSGCGKIYWEGSHMTHMRVAVERILRATAVNGRSMSTQ